VRASRRPPLPTRPPRRPVTDVRGDLDPALGARRPLDPPTPRLMDTTLRSATHSTLGCTHLPEASEESPPAL
jgi:hypothetical protein